MLLPFACRSQDDRGSAGTVAARQVGTPSLIKVVVPETAAVVGLDKGLYLCGNEADRFKATTIGSVVG